MSFDAIRAALDGRLATLPSWNATRIAWPNTRYAPLAQETYLQASFSSAEPSQAEIGTSGRNRQRGLYVVSVIAPAGDGMGESLAIADRIADHFPRGLDLSATGFAVTIVKAWAAPSFSRDSWFVTPVTITWDAFTPPN